jgi:cytochrome bd-type quinol oxidase subunit 2
MNLFLLKQAFAQTGVAISPSKEYEQLTRITAESLVGGLVNLALVIAALVFFFMLVMGGIKWITSQGDEGKVKEAREQVTQALIGLVIVFVAFAIAKLINAVFGVDILNLTIPSFRPAS